MRNDVIVENENYMVTSDSIIEGNWIVTVDKQGNLVSNYETSPVDSMPNVMKIRLNINGNDNELLPSQYHYVNLDNGNDSAFITACLADSIKPTEPCHNVEIPESLHVKIDMKNIRKALAESKYFVTPTRDTIYSIDNIVIDMGDHRRSLNLDKVTWNSDVIEATLPLGKTAAHKFEGWKKSSNNISPSYTSKQPIVNALYNMSIENLRQPGGFLLAQECYEIALSRAYIYPKESMESLKTMVTDSVINAQPGGKTYSSIANDMIWAEAAWSVFCATGDKQWLAYAFAVTNKSLTQVNALSLDAETGLYHAMSPYIAVGRQQYYPPWMSTRDMWESQPMIANAIMEHSYRLLSLMADEFEVQNHYATKADQIKDAINHRLWNENRGFYTQYLYGGIVNMMSPCVDNLGQALAILWDIADDNRAETILNETPVTNYGIPLLYPRRSEVGSLLNNGVFPFVQAMWNLAAAKNENMSLLRRGMGALIRQQAMVGTCGTSCNATTGAPLGYAPNLPFNTNTCAGVNAAGNIAMVLKVIGGMNFLPNGIEFNPKVPVCFGGTKTISDFKYRNATLNITIMGTGNQWSKITLDGKKLDDNFIDGKLKGEHQIVITMNNEYAGSGKTTLAQNIRVLPNTPMWLWDGFYGTNYNYTPKLGYKILINGEKTYSMPDSVMGTRDTMTFRTYSLVAINKFGFSYIAQPHSIYSTARCLNLAKSNPSLATNDTQYNNIILSNTSTAKVPIRTTAAGNYIVDIYYNNPVSQTCNFVKILANGHYQGAIATPYTLSGYRYSTRLKIKLLKGENTITLQSMNPAPIMSEPFTLEMSHLRIIKS